MLYWMWCSDSSPRNEFLVTWWHQPYIGAGYLLAAPILYRKWAFHEKMRKSFVFSHCLLNHGALKLNWPKFLWCHRVTPWGSCKCFYYPIIFPNPRENTRHLLLYFTTLKYTVCYYSAVGKSFKHYSPRNHGPVWIGGSFIVIGMCLFLRWRWSLHTMKLLKFSFFATHPRGKRKYKFLWKNSSLMSFAG